MNVLPVLEELARLSDRDTLAKFLVLTTSVKGKAQAKTGESHFPRWRFCHGLILRILPVGIKVSGTNSVSFYATLETWSMCAESRSSAMFWTSKEIAEPECTTAQDVSPNPDPER
jgi:hypothetical protein